MSDDLDYRKTRDKAAGELSGLMEMLEAIDHRRQIVTSRINALRDMVFATSNVLGENPYMTHPELFPELIEPEVGFTDAIREVLKTSITYLSPVDIRNELQRRKFDLEKYKNPLAAIHQILRRLDAAKEIEKHPDDDKKLYRWRVNQNIRFAPSGGDMRTKRGGGSLREMALGLANENIKE